MTFYLTSYFHGARNCERFDTSEARDVLASHLLQRGWHHLNGETRHMHFGLADIAA